MRLGYLLGIATAMAVHAGILLFGGIFSMGKTKDAISVQAVDLLSNVAEEEKKKPEEQKEEKPEDLETEKEQPPDAAEIMRNLDKPQMDEAPALEAASLSAIEAALSGQSVGGDFAEALSLASGGKIGALRHWQTLQR